MNKKPHILLGVTGSISAYKSADLISLLTKKGFDVEVILTQNAKHFIPELPLQVLSQKFVHTDTMFEPDVTKVNHIECAKKCDLFLVAPASANIIGKFANGIADDLLSTVALAVPENTPKMIAPAMNTQMYENKIFQRNLNTLKELGWIELEPRVSALACGDVGRGALKYIHEIIEDVCAYFEKD